MAATSKIQIYAFESNFERAVEQVLDAAGVPAYVEKNSESLPATHVAITFASGEAINLAVLPNHEEVYDFFNARLTLQITTERPEDQPSLISGVASLHEEFAARVRAALEERANPFTTANLPYYAVKTIRQLGTARDIDPRWLVDYTRIEFLVQFGIRSDAWPA